MKISNIAPNAFTGGKFLIPNNKLNHSVEYLYNKVSKIVKEHHVPASFAVDRIEISAEKSQAKAIKAGLEENKITYITDMFQKSK